MGEGGVGGLNSSISICAFLSTLSDDGKGRDSDAASKNIIIQVKMSTTFLNLILVRVLKGMQLKPSPGNTIKNKTYNQAYEFSLFPKYLASVIAINQSKTKC